MISPVHTLTPEQAVLELEQLLDSRPPEDQTLALIHWRKNHQTRVDELNAWLMMHVKPEAPASPEAEEPAPFEPVCFVDTVQGVEDSFAALMSLDEEEPIPAPVPALVKPPKPVAPVLSPMEQIRRQIAHVETATTKALRAQDKTGFKRFRNQIHQARFQIRAIAKKHDIPMSDLPALPEVPADPWAKPAPPPKPVPPSKPANPKIQRSKAAQPRVDPTPSVSPAPSIVSPEIVRNLINELLGTARAVQGLAVLLAPWSNPAVVDQLSPHGLMAVAELMAIVGQHVEGVAEEAGRVA